MGYPRQKFLLMQLFGVSFFALTIPLSGLLAEFGRRRVMIVGTIVIAIFGFFLAPLFAAGTAGAIATMVLGFVLMGMIYGPVGTVLSEMFPTAVRYTGSSLAFSAGGILGASLAPSIATWLALHYGLRAVGYYLSTAALISLAGLLSIRETKHRDLGAHWE
jgi:MFS family permease